MLIGGIPPPQVLKSSTLIENGLQLRDRFVVLRPSCGLFHMDQRGQIEAQAACPENIQFVRAIRERLKPTASGNLA